MSCHCALNRVIVCWIVFVNWYVIFLQKKLTDMIHGKKDNESDHNYAYFPTLFLVKHLTLENAASMKNLFTLHHLVTDNFEK